MKAAIFDIDGTLLDSMPIWSDLGLRYLEKNGIQAEKNLGKILFPMTMAESAAYMKEKYHLKQSTEEIVQGVYKIVENFYRYEAQLKPGADTYIRHLHKKGVPMILATSGNKALAGAALKRLGVLDYFQGILSVDEYKTSKHEPDIYLQAAKLLHKEPKECVVFEDVLYALVSAKEAGFLCAGVKDEASANDWLKIQRIADYWIEDFSKAK